MGWDLAQTSPHRTGTCLPFLHRFVKSLRWLRELWVARCPPSDLWDYSNLCWLIWLIRLISTRPQSSRRMRGERTRRSLRNANKHFVLFLCLWGLWAFTNKKDIPPPPLETGISIIYGGSDLQKWFKCNGIWIVEKTHIINGFSHLENRPDHVTTKVRHSVVVRVEEESFKNKRNFARPSMGGKKSLNAWICTTGVSQTAIWGILCMWRLLFVICNFDGWNVSLHVEIKTWAASEEEKGVKKTKNPLKKSVSRRVARDVKAEEE